MSSTARSAPAGLQLWIRRLQTEAGRQTTVLYGAQLAASALNFLFLTALAKTLGIRGYGVYALCFASIISVVGSLFDFGLFPAGARLLAVAKEEGRERRLLGAMFLGALTIGTLLALFLVGIGPLVDRLRPNETPVAWILAAAAPFAVVIPMQLMVELACQGTNRIGALAFLRVAQPIAGLTLVGALLFVQKLSPWTAVLASLWGVIVAVALATVLLRPAVGGVLAELREAIGAAREYGFFMYLGRCVGLASSRLDLLLIPFFIGDVAFGLYSVTQRLAEPVTTLARSMAQTRFKAFANRTFVSGYILRWNLGLLLVAVLGLAVGGPIAVTLLFGPKWYPVRPLLIPFAAAVFFAGLMQPYNMFLTAHGKGRELRNIALLLGVVNLAGLLAVVRPFGVTGAALWAAGIAAFNFVLNLYYYRRVRKELETQGNEHHDGSGV